MANDRLQTVSEFANSTLMGFINDALDVISLSLAGLNDPEVVTQQIITTTITKPIGFISFIPQKGNYPVIIQGTQIVPLPGAPSSITIKYAVAKPHITSDNDSIPLPDYMLPVLVMLVCQYAQNTYEFDITQDKLLSDQVIAALTRAKAGQ
jgi:hypothetical protein